MGDVLMPRGNYPPLAHDLPALNPFPISSDVDWYAKHVSYAFDRLRVLIHILHMKTHSSPIPTAKRLRAMRLRKARGVQVIGVEIDTAQMAEALKATGLAPADMPLTKEALGEHAALLIAARVQELKNYAP